jgi:hypothetical protein
MEALNSPKNLFAVEQEKLKDRILSNVLRLVQLDPDGTLDGWLGVVVRHPTGIVYANQCAGVATENRLVEGYLQLLGGSQYDVDRGMISLGPFTDAFHEGDACKYVWRGREVPTERLAQLAKLVGEIPYWLARLDASDTKQALRLDRTRIDEIAEAWIPVETPDGPGVLVHKNCD